MSETIMRLVNSVFLTLVYLFIYLPPKEKAVQLTAQITT
jgi:hypothetical protein